MNVCNAEQAGLMRVQRVSARHADQSGRSAAAMTHNFPKAADHYKLNCRNRNQINARKLAWLRRKIRFLIRLTQRLFAHLSCLEPIPMIMVTLPASSPKAGWRQNYLGSTSRENNLRLPTHTKQNRALSCRHLDRTCRSR